MSTIKVKRTTGSTTPTGLTFGEPAFVDGLNSFYVTKNNGTSVRVGAEVEASPGDWTNANKLATQSAINTTFMPKSGGAFSGDVSFSGGSDIRFIETGGGTDYVAFQAPASIAANVTWTLPNADGGSGQVLSTNGSGTLSWADTSSATTVTTTSDDTNTTRYLVFSTTAGSGKSLYVDDTTGPLSYNPSTEQLAVGDMYIGTDATISTIVDDDTLTIDAPGSAESATITLTGSAADSTITITASGDTTVTNDLVVGGNFTVNGTTTTINATTITVDDKNIELGSVTTPTDTTADGGGITLKGSTDKTIIWDNANDNWTSSEHWNLASGKVFKINNTEVLSSTTLGSAVVSSSLTSVGTIATGTWQATDIGLAYGGTNASLTAANGGVVYSTATALEISAVGTSGQVLTSAGAAAPTWTSQSSLSVGTATNLAGGGAGQIAYQSGAGSTTFLTTSSTAGAVVASTGTGTAPEYKVISLTNGSVTSGSGTLTLAVQDADADGTTKGIAAFNATNFDAASGVISIDTVDGGSY